MNSSRYSRNGLEKLSKAELIDFVIENTKKQQNHTVDSDHRAEKQLFEALVDTVNEALFIEANDSHEILYCNQAAVDLFEVESKAELIGKQGKQYYKKPLSANENDKLAKALKNNQKWKNTYCYHSATGKEFWGFLTITLISILGKDYQFVSLTNATEYIQRQVKLNEQKRWLHAILESTDDVIWSVDNGYHLTMYNTSFEKSTHLLGGSEAKLGEHVFSDKYAHWPTHYWKACYDRALKGEKFRSEFEYENSADELYCLDNSFHPILDKAEHVIGVAVISRDVTEYKRIQDHLKKHQRLLNEMEKLTSIGGWEYQLDSDELYWTDETYRMHELEIGTKVDRDYAISLYSPDVQKVMWAALERLVTKGERYDMELPRKTAKGNPIWVRTVSNIEYENGTPKRIYGAFQNITERKKAENDLKQAKKSLEEALAEKENFVSVVSHEIRTPLNAIIGMVDFLDQDASVEENKENISALKTTSLSLLSFINDILDFSKIQSGKLRLEKVDFNVNLILQQTKQIFLHQAQKKGLELEANVAANVPNFVKGDPTRMLQVLNNLVGNAIKFTDAGKVSMHVKPGAQVNEKQVSLIIEVKDTGIGIPSNKLKEIFEPFSQADVDINRNYGGTGLGLSIVKNLVEIQGGKIEVESVENKGTTFRIFLAFEKGIEIREDMMAEDKKSLALLNVLYIEDVVTNQLLMKRICSRWNVKISLASNGHEGLKKAKSKQYDIILVDLRMSGVDGFETAKRIRSLADDYFKKVPIIAVTASSLEENMDLVREAGMDDALVKPIIQERLYEIFTKYAKAKKINTTRKKVFQTSKTNEKNIFDQLDMIFQKDPQAYQKTLLSIRKEFQNYKEKLKTAVIEGDDEEVSNVRHKISGTSFILEHRSFYTFLKSLNNLQAFSDQRIKALLKDIDHGFDELIEEFDKKIQNLGRENNES